MLESLSENPTLQPVGSVVKNSKQNLGQTWHFHVVPVVRTPTIVGREEVFNISVEDEEEYFANNILVHNCRYALQMDAMMSTRRTAEITFGAQKHYGGDEYAPVISEETFIPHRYEQ